ncbi:MAG: class I adenylate-forming enzyme family protein [Acidimicrobiales bacterium]
MTVPISETHAALTGPAQLFEMDEVEIRGVRTRVWKNAPASLRAILETSRGHGGSIFVVHEDERVSFEDHYVRAATFARRLVEGLGVRKGDRVAIAMRNLPEWVVAFWGAASVGAIVVPLNAWWTGPELAYGLADSGAKVLVADGQRIERLTPHLGELDLVGIIGVRGGEERVGAGAAGGQILNFSEFLGALDPTVALPAMDLEPDDDATIFYTSGTTGKPKGALGTQRNICGNLISLIFGSARSAMRSAASRRAEAGQGGQNAYLLSVPLFHATGCHSVLLANTALGGKLVMMHRWDPERALELIERERVTVFGGVPAMVWQVLESPDLAKRDTSSVTGISYGGAPAPPELVRRIAEHFPGRVPGNGYGLTETSSVTTFNGGDDYLAHPDSVGAAVPVCDLQVVDGGGNVLAPGSIGELWIKGPNVVKGYWNKPVETAEAITDGWLHTGDVARLDDEGFVFIVDRAKDMVIRGGENVYCVEVEAALFEHPAVSDAAVIGIPHQVLGEEVGAVVHLAPGMEATEQELKDHLASRLAAFKIPARMWFRDEPLPRNPAGKVLKRELRDELVGTSGS